MVVVIPHSVVVVDVIVVVIVVAFVVVVIAVVVIVVIMLLLLLPSWLPLPTPPFPGSLFQATQVELTLENPCTCHSGMEQASLANYSGSYRDEDELHQ